MKMVGVLMTPTFWPSSRSCATVLRISGESRSASKRFISRPMAEARARIVGRRRSAWLANRASCMGQNLPCFWSQHNGVMNFSGLGSADFDPNRTFMPSGQGAGLIHEIKPAAEVFADLLRETEAALRKSQQWLSGDPARQHSAAPARQG